MGHPLLAPPAPPPSVPVDSGRSLMLFPVRRNFPTLAACQEDISCLEICRPYHVLTTPFQDACQSLPPGLLCFAPGPTMKGIACSEAETLQRPVLRHLRAPQRRTPGQIASALARHPRGRAFFSLMACAKLTSSSHGCGVVFGLTMSLAFLCRRSDSNLARCSA